MRGDRIKCLGLRTDRTSCMNATDSICRRARMESQSVVKRGQSARVENAPKKAQLSKVRREARRSRPQGPAQIESVALCVWQCHLRNVSTLSNRTRDSPGDVFSFGRGPAFFGIIPDLMDKILPILIFCALVTAAEASWYWPFGDSEPEPPRLSELVERASELIGEASDLSADGKVRNTRSQRQGPSG